ncbi:MAG: M50 family metallopeptidase [Bacteroidota bacterium]
MNLINFHYFYCPAEEMVNMLFIRMVMKLPGSFNPININPLDLIYVILFFVTLAVIITGSFGHGFKVSRFLMLTVLVFFLPGLSLRFFHSLILLYHSPVFLALLAGSGAGILLYILVLRKFSAFGTFEHELTHALVALLFLNRIRKFVVTRRSGGYITYSGGYGGQFAHFMIGLAPYFLPTYSVILILARFALPDNWFPWYDVLVGMTLAYYLISNVEEIRRNWTKSEVQCAGSSEITRSDIAQAGYIFSLFFIAGLTLFVYTLLFYMLSATSLWSGRFFQQLWSESIAFYEPRIIIVWHYLNR